MSESRNEEKQKAPDGGWSWLVCFGSSLITLSLRCIDPSFGLLFGSLLDKLHANSTTISMIMSTMDATASFSGLLVGPMLKKFTYRQVAIAATVVYCIGLILTSMADSIVYIICTYSIIGGIGNGVAVACAFVALNTHFKKKRGRAVGFSMAGVTIAMMFLPQLVEILLPRYGFSGTLLFLGALAFHSTIGACLLSPLPKQNTGKQEALMSTCSVKINEDTKPISMTKNEPSFNHHEKNEKMEKRRDSLCKKLVEFFDLDLLKDPKYVSVVIGCSFYYVAETNFKLITTFFLLDLGITPQEVASYLSLTAFTDILARLTMPTIFDKLKWKKRTTFWICSMLVGIGRSITAETSRGPYLTTMFVIIGFLRGATLVNLNLSVSECCSLKKLPSAFGMYMVSKGVCVLIFSPIIGYVRDYSGSYRICIHMMTLMITITFVAWSVEYLINFYHHRMYATPENAEKRKIQGG